MILQRHVFILYSFHWSPALSNNARLVDLRISIAIFSGYKIRSLLSVCHLVWEALELHVPPPQNVVNPSIVLLLNKGTYMEFPPFPFLILYRNGECCGALQMWWLRNTQKMNQNVKSEFPMFIWGGKITSAFILLSALEPRLNTKIPFCGAARV